MSLWLPSKYFQHMNSLPVTLFISNSNQLQKTGMSVLLQQHPDKHEWALPRMSETLRRQNHRV
jgi:hypothetical protein